MAKKTPGAQNNKTVQKTTPFNALTIVKVSLFLLLSGLFVYLTIAVSHVQDDAFITFRYVRNFIGGNGLVFNAGERVEGYTNFLWTMLLTIPAYLKINIIDASQYLSVLFGILILFVTWQITQLTGRKLLAAPGRTKAQARYFSLLSFLPVLMLTLTGAFSYWAVSGMETTMFGFFNLAAVFFYLNNNEKWNNNYLVAGFLALSALTRPEGYLLCALFCLYSTIHLVKNSRGAEPGYLTNTVLSRNSIITVSIFLLPAVLHTSFRLYYYGHLLPNTFYAKANFSAAALKEGFAYLEVFLKDYLLYGVVLMLPLLSLAGKKLRYELGFLYLLITGYSLYVISIGGDVLPLHRFWLPVLPLLYMLWTLGILYLALYLQDRNSKMQIPLTVLTVLFTLAFSFGNFRGNERKISRMTDKEIGLVDQFKQKADILNKLAAAKNKRLTLAASTIGALSYYTDATIIDMLGLTDETIARHPQTIDEISNDPEVSWKEKRYNAEYVVSRKPDYILFSTGTKPSAYAERALFAVNGFFADYFNQFIPTSSGKFLYIYARKTEQQKRLNNPAIQTGKINPEFIRHYTHLLHYLNLFREGRKDVFITVKNEFDETIKTCPSFFSEPFRIMGDACFMARDYPNAEGYYNKALAADSLNILAYYGSCYLYQRLGDQGKTVAMVKKIYDYALIDNSIFPDLDLFRVFARKGYHPQ